jgi:GH35 family endo-1,4-beta-xylanase
MIALGPMSFQSNYQITETFSIAELPKHKGQELIPTSEVLDVFVSTVLACKIVEVIPVHECNQLRENELGLEHMHSYLYKCKVTKSSPLTPKTGRKRLYFNNLKERLVLFYGTVVNNLNILNVMNIKVVRSFFCVVTGGLFAVSCANTNMDNISVDEPASMSEYDYLNDYSALKTYIDHAKYPNFKLGAGASASDLSASNIMARLTYANFDEVTAGNAFKYSSCVAADGTMDFSTVQKFIEKANDNGLSVYGHTLVWHSQQQVSYLKGLITDPNAVNYILHITTPEAGTHVYSWQLFAHTTQPLEVGKTYVLKMRVKTSEDYTVTCWPAIDGGNTQYNPTPTINSTTEWTTISSSFKANIAIDELGFQFGTLGGDLYLDDVSKVKAWDVVNEPMSDTYPDSLKSGAVEGNTKTNFYWQDYLGKDYARIAVRLARKYGPDSLKLFVNDYNLEAAYNHNAKCQGLIKMIKYWESDGVTKIDGIGSQMHVSYSMDSTKQKRNEDAYVNMLNLLAATGKLVRISELDMGCLDSAGNTVMTANLTDNERKGMAEYYKFIVEKYLQLIPVAQQYGICQWSVTDSPSSSSWRAGQPIGLWDESYNRKSTYGGFADGLMEK